MYLSFAYFSCVGIFRSAIFNKQLLIDNHMQCVTVLFIDLILTASLLHPSFLHTLLTTYLMHAGIYVFLDMHIYEGGPETAVEWSKEI